MRRVRRPIAILMSLVLAQLMLVLGGYACVMRGSGAAMTASMPGMSMPVTVEIAPTGTSNGNQAPCEFPWAPGACQGMAPCAPAALIVASTAPDVAGKRVPESALTLELIAPASLSLAPELPPPRAQST
jgi:hypothetical protein